MTPLASAYLEELERLIRHCQSSSAGGFTPSDFPQAELTQSELDDLIASLPRTDDGSKKKQIETIYPLSPLQQGILFHCLYDNSSSMYVSHLSCALSGELDLPAFKQAWQRVVDRHAVLRTMFVWEGLRKPLQVVRQHVNSPWIEHDWLQYSAAEQKKHLETYLATDRKRSFDLLHAPLMRLTLIRMNEDRYHFIWSLHHMLMDGWSAMTITRAASATTSHRVCTNRCGGVAGPPSGGTVVVASKSVVVIAIATSDAVLPAWTVRGREGAEAYHRIDEAVHGFRRLRHQRWRRASRTRDPEKRLSRPRVSEGARPGRR